MQNSPPTEKQLALMRVLIALAWADGEISNEEINFLKDFFYKFDFSGEDWAKIELYLEDPIPPDEAEVLIQDFVQRLGGKKEREEVISLLEGLTSSDGVRHPEEEAFLKRFYALVRESGPASALIGGIKGLFRETLLKQNNGSRRKEELDDFLNNRILFKVRRALEREKLDIEAHPNELAYASLFAGLLAFAASAHDPLSPPELKALGRSLKSIEGFNNETVTLIVSVVQDADAKNLDAFRMSREFYTRSSIEQRRQLLDCLFDVAGADDHLAHAEVEAARSIAYNLRFSHRDFIDAKVKHRKQKETQ